MSLNLPFHEYRRSSSRRRLSRLCRLSGRIPARLGPGFARDFPTCPGNGPSPRMLRQFPRRRAWQYRRRRWSLHVCRALVTTDGRVRLVRVERTAAHLHPIPSVVSRLAFRSWRSRVWGYFPGAWGGRFVC